MASANLSRTPSSAGSARKGTWSWWIKKSPTTNAPVYSILNSTSHFELWFTSSSTIEFRHYNGSSYNMRLISNRVFRDTSAWYHFVVELDTTQATAANRVKIYVNGTQETSFSTETYPAQNADLVFAKDSATKIGSRYNDSNYLDGSLTHFHFIDGTAYDADTFGETDSTTGIWKPKTAPSVTYGTNGFFLKFENSSSMGTDSSGNSNTFTVNGTMTQTIDTPSNVFATLNSLAASQSTVTYSLGNTKAQFANSWHGTISTLGASKGKYYWEMKLTGDNTNNFFGVCSDAVASYLHQSNVQDSTTGHVLWEQLGALSVNNTQTTSYFSAKSSGDIFGMALDLDSATKTIQFYKNGSADGSAVNLPSNMQDGLVFPLFVGNSSSVTAIMECNFGNGYFGTTAVSSAQNPDDGIGIFEYDVPAGYRALCTKSINAEEYS